MHVGARGLWSGAVVETLAGGNADVYGCGGCGGVFDACICGRCSMKNYVVAFVSGLVFSIGLGISGMVKPSKVIGFLDFFGDWDPSLAFVMGGAVCCDL